MNELLSEFPFLYQSMRIKGRQEWFALSDVSSPLVNKGLRFDLLSILIMTIRSNLDVALPPRFATQHDLGSGDIVILRGVPTYTRSRFIMIWRKEKSESEYLQIFRNWLFSKSVVLAARRWFAPHQIYSDGQAG